MLNKDLKPSVLSLDTLTGLRFYAALHVVLFHNIYLFGDSIQNLPPFIRLFVQKGESAVSFFFLLSGFILTHAYKDKLQNSTHRVVYFVARIAKIYPLYLVAFILDIPRVLTYFYAKYDSYVAIKKVIISALFSLLMIQSWIPNLTSVWNSPAWSLSCEAFFYVFFAYMLHPILKIKYKKTALMAIYLAPIVIYVFMVDQMHIPIENPFYATLFRSFPALRITEFIIGILIYAFYSSDNSFIKIVKNHSSVFFWSSITLSILATNLLSEFPKEIFSQIFMVPLFSIIIISGTYDSLKLGIFFSSKMILLLGRASYALYIIHQPIKYYFEMALSPSIHTGVIYFLGVVAISLILFKLFESPTQTKIKNFYFNTFGS